MSIRLLKIGLVICIGLQALLYALQNVVNLDAAYGAVAYVFSMADHVVYPDHVGPPVTWAPLVWVSLAMIIVGETLVGALCFRGAWDLWRARRSDPASFAQARHYAVLGCGLALVVWIGLFMALGGAYFQMWQTEGGGNSLEGAFMYAVSSAVVLLFVNQPETPAPPPA
jgi:predicted small integral membrane protein